MDVRIVDLARKPELSNAVKIALMDIRIGWRDFVEDAVHAVVIIEPEQFLTVEALTAPTWSFRELQRRTPNSAPGVDSVEMAVVVRGRGFLDVCCAGLITGSDHTHFKRDVIRCLAAASYINDAKIRRVVGDVTPFGYDSSKAELFFVDMLCKVCMSDAAEMLYEDQRSVHCFRQIEARLWQRV